VNVHFILSLFLFHHFSKTHPISHSTGRTGTLICGYMMKYHGFTAAECMGYTRLCRPGFVVGPQQNYLVEYETILQREKMAGTSGFVKAPGTPIREKNSEDGQPQQQHTPQPRKLDGKSRGLETLTGMVCFLVLGTFSIWWLHFNKFNVF